SGGHQRRHRADDGDEVWQIECGYEFVPWGHRYADGEQQRIGDRGREEFVDNEPALLQVRRHRVSELGEHGKEQHGDRRGQSEQAVAHDAQKIERYCREARSRYGCDIDRGARLVLRALLAGIHFVVLAGLESTLACQAWITFADVVERTREEDRCEAAEHHRRQHLGEHVAVGLAQNLRIADGERDRALADTAGHDRDYHEEEGVKGAEPEHGADQRADDAGRDRANRQWHEYFQKPLHQHLAVHTEDAADDDAGDKQVEEVGILGKLDDRFLDLRRQQLVIGESRGDKGGKNCRCADVAKHRRTLSDFSAGEAANHQNGNHDGDFALDVASENEANQERDEDGVNRDRDDPDPQVDDLPPSFRPPTRPQHTG